MKTANLSDLVTRLGRGAEAPGPPDADLLGRFLADRDEGAFALIVRRHGPTVFGVCRRVTGDHHLAEDAFQAVFVILAAKAGSVRPRSALPAWLHGVAYRVALRARTVNDRRRRRETLAETLPEPAAAPPGEAEAADLARVVDEEIARLPDEQRIPVVLCELEGRPRHEAAARLGISEGTLSSRLARARKALADQLRQRGVALSTAGLTAALARLAPASVPGGLSAKALACAVAPGLVPASVATLSQGVLRLMFIQKLKVLTLTLAAALGLLASAMFVGGQLVAADPPAGATSTTVAVFGPLSPTPGQPAPKPAGKPLPQGPNRLLLWRDGTHALIDPDGKNEKKAAGDREKGDRERGAVGARLSPDGKTFAFLVKSKAGEGSPPTLHVRALDDKGPGTDLGAECQTFCWSPDGAEFACSDFTDTADPWEAPKATHFVLDVKTKEKKPLKLPADHLLTDWSRDGQYFLTMRVVRDKEKPQMRLYLMNRDGTEHKALTDEKQFSALGRLSPDGKRVLYRLLTLPKEKDKGQPKQELAVFDIPTGKAAAVGDTPLNGEIFGYCWSPDGKRIAYTWREVHEGKPEDVRAKETESFLVVCDPDGKNQKTIASEKGQGQWILTIGHVDWR
ncbi:MAG: hypothetical protein C0501_31225 [Isosphaera sp.]|nr:hypothetical protein [Isosphaera sp.]